MSARICLWGLLGFVGIIQVASCDCSDTALQCLCPQERKCENDDECPGGSKCQSGCCGGCVGCVVEQDCRGQGECCRDFQCTTECGCGQKCTKDQECVGQCMKCDRSGCCVNVSCDSDEDCPDEPCTVATNPLCPASGKLPRFCEIHPVMQCRICQYDRCDAARYLGEDMCSDPTYGWYVPCEDGVPWCLGGADGTGVCECRMGCFGGQCQEDQFCCKKERDPTQWACLTKPQDHCPEVECPPCTKVKDDPGGVISEETCVWVGADCSCVDLDPLPAAFAGQHLSMALGKDGNPVFAGYYGKPYGDLIFGKAPSATTGAEILWSFVDGVPLEAPCEGKKTGPRDGIKEPGVNVGWDTSIAVNSGGDPLIAYYDLDNQDLKFAYRIGAEPWKISVVDNAGNTGRYASLALDPGGVPWIAFMTVNLDNFSSIQLAKADLPVPTSWTMIPIEKVAVTPPASGVEDRPKGVGVFAQLAFYSDGTPAVAYYDSLLKKLKFAWWDNTNGAFVVETIAPRDQKGAALADVGANVSLFVEQKGARPADVVHLVFQDGIRGDLYYLRFLGNSPLGAESQLIDAGGRDSTGNFVADPEKAEGAYHEVGNFASLVVDSQGVVRVAYQDATSLDLVFASKGTNGVWVVTIEKAKKNQTNFDGAFGFFTNQILDGSGNGSLIGFFKHNLMSEPWGSRVEILQKL